MLRRKMQTTIIIGLGIVLYLMVFNSAAGSAISQQVIIQVSPDGSLVIQDRYGGETKHVLEGKNVVDMVASQWNVQVIRGSSSLADRPIVTRGRSGHRGVKFSSAAACRSTSSHPLPQPLNQSRHQPALVPDTAISSLIDKTSQEITDGPEAGASGGSEGIQL